MNYENRTFVVTGGGSGLGRSVAKDLHDAGANVVIADIVEPDDQGHPGSLNERTLFRKCDITQPKDAESVFAGAREVFGPVHGLINCAGVAPAEKILSRGEIHDLERFERVVRVNLFGTFNMIAMAAKFMTQNEPGEDGQRGVIVNTASIAAFEGQIGQAAYAASKGGVAALTLPAARELASHGIRVVTIAPGTFATPMMEAMPSEVQDQLAATIPFPKRLGRASEFSALVKHILENTMLNGTVLRLDGALRMASR